MEAKSKWLTEDGNIVAPNTIDSCVFGSDGKSLEEKLPFRFGIDENGNYGYYKVGADTVTPFKSGDGGYNLLAEGTTLYGGSFSYANDTENILIAKMYESYSRSSQYCMFYYGEDSANIEINGGLHQKDILLCVIRPGHTFMLNAQVNSGCKYQIYEILNISSIYS